MQTNEIFNNLNPKKGQKLTMWRLGDMGFPSSKHIVLIDIEKTSYAPHDKVLIISYTEKRKRNTRSFYIFPHMKVVFWLGHITVDADMGPEGGNTSLTCFSPEYLQIALNSVTNTPLIVVGENTQ